MMTNSVFSTMNLLSRSQSGFMRYPYLQRIVLTQSWRK